MSESSQRHKAKAPKQLTFSIIMCSTSRFVTAQNGRKGADPSGDLIAQSLTDSGHVIASRVLVPDDEKMIKNAIEKALKNEIVKAIIICGGTGIAPKDVTIETGSSFFEKVSPGFGELFRKLSYDEVGSAAIMSRAVAGVVKGKAVFCIPGSINAVQLCLDKLILPETGHIVKHAREMT